MNAIDYSLKFGGVIKQYYCPHCGDTYHIDIREIHEGLTDCWKCHRMYFQRICHPGNIKFVVKYVHTCRGQ